MSKDLPYFRFYTAEWQNGDITLEDDETQGVFINVCCYYWTKDCDVTKQMLSKRFASAKQVLDKLFFAKIIKESATGLLEINFLDEQYERLVGLSKKRSKAGKLGGLAKVANAKQMPSKCLANAKQMPIYKDKDKDKEYMSIFDSTRKLFPGSKRGLEPEFENFVKKNKDYAEVIPLLEPAIKREIEHKQKLVDAGQFCAQWKNFKTWINEKCWTEEFPEYETVSGYEMMPDNPHEELNSKTLNFFRNMALRFPDTFDEKCTEKGHDPETVRKAIQP